MSEPTYQDSTQYTSNKSPVMIGCGCKNVKDVVTFMREKKIDYVELAWADEMGLWHNETVPVRELTFANLQEGVPCKDGRFLLPDPLSARIAPLTQPNTMLFTCKPPTNRANSLKTKQLNPGWIEMISKKLMENDKRPVAPDRSVTAGDLVEDPAPPKTGGKKRSANIAIENNGSGGGGGGGGSNGSSPCGSPSGSPSSSPPTSNGFNGNSPPHVFVNGSPPASSPSNGSFIEWKIVRNENFGSSSPPALVFPQSPSPDSPVVTPPGSVPGSPYLPGSPHSPVPDSQQDAELLDFKSLQAYSPHVPPLLRPRQIHPTKANKLGITKPVKKRRNTEHLYCRHCGTTETPEWRRGPDGRKSLCNACGLYFSKMIKRETLVVPQGRRVAIDALLNPHS